MDGIFQFRFCQRLGTMLVNRKQIVIVRLGETGLYCGLSYLESQHVPPLTTVSMSFEQEDVGHKDLFQVLEKFCPEQASRAWICAMVTNDSSFRG
jgi:hypothetical protein